jgi:hypothetical protein
VSLPKYPTPAGRALMEKGSPARRAYFVFGKTESARRRADVLARIAAPSKLLS